MENEQFAQNMNMPPEPVPQSYSSEMVQKPKKHRKFFIVLGIIVLVIIVGAALFGMLFYRGWQDAQKAGNTLTYFLTYLSNGDNDNAYSLIANKWKADSTEDKFIQDMSTLKLAFSEFKSQQTTGWHVQAYSGAPYTCFYQGKITHTDGKTDNFEAVLIIENGGWKVLSIRFDLSPERIRQLQSSGGASLYDAFNNFISVTGVVGE